MAEGRAEACTNCGAVLAGEWCHACGQRRFRPEQRTLRHLAGALLRAATDLDGRLPKTLFALVARPGTMAREYLAGARRRYLSPITLFLLVNLVYFLAPPLSDLDPTLYEHLTYQPYSTLATQLVDARLAARGTTMADYAVAYEARQSAWARSLVILHVPFLALGLALLQPRGGHPFADHVLVAFWAMTLVVLAVLAVPPALMLLATAVGAEAVAGTLWRVGFLLVLGGWLFSLLRGAYGQSATRALLKLPLLLVALVLSSQAYRLLLFLATFAAT